MAIDETIVLADLDADWTSSVRERAKLCSCRVCAEEPAVRIWIDGKIRELEMGVRDGRPPSAWSSWRSS